MAAAAHSPGGFGGVPQSVGKEYSQADKAKKKAKKATAMKADSGGNAMSGY
jgi:hypothetical protein